MVGCHATDDQRFIVRMYFSFKMLLHKTFFEQFVVASTSEVVEKLLHEENK
jgi:hypothetical protein